MKPKYTKYLLTNLLAFTLIGLFNLGITNVVLAQANLGFPELESGQRTITELDDNGLPAPVVAAPNNATSYLLTAVIFGGAALLAIVIYRRTPDNKYSNKTKNENQKL